MILSEAPVPAGELAGTQHEAGSGYRSATRRVTDKPDGDLPRSGRTGMVMAFPQPRQLAELGTLLCLFRAQYGSELSGWTHAVRAEACAGMDSDGLRESVSFFTADGRCCWRLYLLPESDFLAWDRLQAGLPASGDSSTACTLADRLWKRLAGRLFGDGWRASILRLHVLSEGGAPPVLATSLAPVSPFGLSVARRIARIEGAEGDVSVDDCCCARSAFDARQRVGSIAAGQEAVPVIRPGTKGLK